METSAQEEERYLPRLLSSSNPAMQATLPTYSMMQPAARFSFFFVAPENDLDVSKPRTAVQKTLAAMRNTLLLAADIAVRRRSSSKHNARTPALGALLLRLPRHAR